MNICYKAVKRSHMNWALGNDNHSISKKISVHFKGITASGKLFGFILFHFLFFQKYSTPTKKHSSRSTNKGLLKICVINRSKTVESGNYRRVRNSDWLSSLIRSSVFLSLISRALTCSCPMTLWV